MELSFCDLRAKQVINLVDGRCLGHIIDMVFEQCGGRILGIVVPGLKRGFNLFRAREDVFIPYHHVCKIGSDTILVELHPVSSVPVRECPPEARRCSVNTNSFQDMNRCQSNTHMCHSGKEFVSNGHDSCCQYDIHTCSIGNESAIQDTRGYQSDVSVCGVGSKYATAQYSKPN